MSEIAYWRNTFIKTEVPVEHEQASVDQPFYSDLTYANKIYCDGCNSNCCLKKEPCGDSEEIFDAETLGKYSCAKRERAFSRVRSLSPQIVDVYCTRQLQIFLPRIDGYACYYCRNLLDLSKTIFTEQGNDVQSSILICSNCKMCRSKQESYINKDIKNQKIKVKWENYEKFSNDMIFGFTVRTPLLDFRCKRCNSEIDQNQRVYLYEYDFILCQNCNESKPLKLSVNKQLIQRDNVMPEIKIKSEVTNRQPFVTNIKCEFCRNVYFFKKRDLKWHLIGEHGVKGVMCTMCNRSFKCQENLKAHIETIHERRVVYPCNVCGRSFTQKGNLLTHVNTKHKNIKLYNCKICNHNFAQKGNLQKHVDFVHKDIRPFKCQLCYTAYASAKILQHHIKINHEFV